MSNMQANYVDLEAAGVKVKSTYGGDAGSFMSLINEINGVLNTAQEAWIGNASEEYQRQWEELMPQFRNAAEILQILGTNIETYAKDLADLEKKHSSQ